MFRNRFFLINLIVAVLLFYIPFIYPFASFGIHQARILSMDQCIKDGQIPCRWVPSLEHFYGSPIFNYYPPLLYYFGELIFTITKSSMISIKSIFSMSLVGSYLSMYLLASKFFAPIKTHLSAIFYTLISFIIMTISAGGVGLAWGLMFLPLIILNLNLLSEKRKMQHFLILSIFLSLLILSANSAPFLISLIFLWIGYRYVRIKSFTFLLLSLLSVLFAFLLSSFYIIPAILESNLVHSVDENNNLRYLPKSAMEKPQTPIDSVSYRVLTGDSDVSNFKQGTNWLRFETDTKTHTIVRLAQFYFPDWKIFIDGGETQVEYKNNSWGLMTIILGKGNHLVEGRLFDTPIRIISNIITIISVIFALFLWIIQFRGVRYWLDYYKKRVS